MPDFVEIYIFFRSALLFNTYCLISMKTFCHIILALCAIPVIKETTVKKRFEIQPNFNGSNTFLNHEIMFETGAVQANEC